MRRLLAIVLLVGCAAPGDLDDEPQDAPESAIGDGKADGASCSQAACGDPAAPNILFPGNPACAGRGCERALAGDAVYIPPRNGAPWGDTYLLGTEAPATLAGYSSGRIALLRRLGLVGDGTAAVMLDPSWEDSARDFLGSGPVRGADIVHDWLAADPARVFVLLYSTRSVGWASYAALATADDVGDRVKVCATSEPHLRIPAIRGLDALLIDPIAWDNGRCRWGEIE